MIELIVNLWPYFGAIVLGAAIVAAVMYLDKQFDNKTV